MARARSKTSVKPEPRVSRYRKPPEMTLEEWQAALRRQFGTSQPFSLRNAGVERVFSDFEVTNPASGRTYPVSIRGKDPGVNSCGCPDYATNLLGTCKHIEFVLARLSEHRWGRTALGKGFHPPFSSVRLVYGAQRQIVFQAGTSASSSLKALASQYFDEGGLLEPLWPGGDTVPDPPAAHEAGSPVAAAPSNRDEALHRNDPGPEGPA